MTAGFIYSATSAECAGPINQSTGVKGRNFLQKLKLMKLQYFCVFMYITCWVCFVFVKSLSKLTKPYCHARTFSTGQPAKRGKYYQQKPNIFTKLPPIEPPLSPLARTPSLGHWYIGYTFGFTIPARTIPPGLLPPPLLRDYKQSIEFPMGVPTCNCTEKGLFSLFMIIFSDYGRTMKF